MGFCKNFPLTSIDPDGATDLRPRPDYVWAQGLEGFAYGKTNNEGYNNAHDYKRGMSIDVLVMGASHMEGYQVQMEDNTSSLLSKISKLKVYNIGASRHYLLTCLCNLQSATEKYNPSKYIVIETGSVKIPDKMLKMAEASTFPEVEDAKNRGTLRFLLRENMYLRLLWGKATHIISKYMQSNKDKDTFFNDSEIMLRLLRQAEETASSCGAKLIIAYHPSVSLNKDGTLKINGDPEIVKQFSDLCAENGIYFLNMAGRFLEEYKNNYILPYGFANTSVGKGHMNRDGHRMFADEIYALIKRIEAES
ncbi:MAG: hypothetical protein IJ587_02765 [Synergistaceae bacterium]|nr:hypothetical protein [Synergistaceae bacterium]